jgi:NAD(P)H-hydrate epimerase
VTVTFGFAKHGLYKFPGAAACGEIVVAPIGIPAEQAKGLRTFALTEEIVRQWLPERSPNSHKGSFGKAMIAAGSQNYAGAAVLSTSAAGRTGAGLVTGAVPETIWSVVASHVTEPTWLPLAAQAGSLDVAAASPLREAIARYSALLLGCGLTQAPHTQRFVHQLLTAGDSPLPPTVIDADGLNALSMTSNWHTLLPATCILTPHVAEFARLLHVEQDEVIALRWELALEAASLWNAVILAKGPYTVVASPDGDLAVLPIATSALATAGTGDVLAGTIVALLAQGVDAFGAACLGAWIHGQAGLRCAHEIGPAGVVASDLLTRIPQVMNALRSMHCVLQ